jgi:hypothetical protein
MRKIRNLWPFVAFSLMALTGGVSAPVMAAGETSSSTSSSSVTATVPQYGQYIGYGYDVTAGVPLYKTANAMKMRSPILDLTNPTVTNAIKVIDPTGAQYISGTSSSVREIAEQYGYAISGGASFGAKIKVLSVSADISTSFNKNTTLSKIMKESYSYHSILARKNSVFLQIDDSKLSSYLSADFLTDIEGVASEAGAKAVLQKYGTHLLTGYQLGGILELTNYFASNTATYSRQVTDSFDTQISTGINLSYGKIQGSFSDSYSSKDNNSSAVNNYKCTTYGGKSFGALTIEDVFQYNINVGTVAESKFTYEKWTESINEGVGLVIVDVPSSAGAIPVWNFLPATPEYNAQRNYMMQAYVSMCNGSYKSFCDAYKDIEGTEISNNTTTVDKNSYTEYGYQYFTPLDNSSGYLSTYIQTSGSTSTSSVVPGSIIALSYDEAPYVGQTVEWKIGSNQSTSVSVIDARNGIFQILDNPALSNVSFQLYVNGVSIKERSFTISSATGFSGGNGSSDNPYLISNKAQLVKLSKTSNLWANSFKLVKDIDFAGECPDVIGTTSTPFSGNFDGGYHCLYNLSYRSETFYGHAAEGGYLGLFGYNSGKISHLKIQENAAATQCTIQIGTSNDYNTIETTANTKYQIIGAVVARNAAGGIVSNCYVNNVRLVANFGSADIANSYLGGVVGFNEGTITDCYFKNSKAHVLSTNADALYVGGITASSNSTKDPSIARCLAESSSILGLSGDATKNTKNHVVYAGGIVGIFGGKMSDCLSRNFVGTQTTQQYGRIIACGQGGNPSSNETAYSGGLVGYLLNSSTALTNCVTSRVTSVYCTMNDMKPAKDTNGKLHYPYSTSDYLGVFVGYAGNASSTSSSSSGSSGTTAYSTKFTNCFVGTTGDGDWIINAYALSGDYIISNEAFFNGISTKEPLTYNLISGSLASDSWYGETTTDNPLLKFEDVSLASDAFTLGSTDSLKKTFYVGENFKAGNITLNGTYTNGSSDSGKSFDIKDFAIDWSAYDKTKVGSYPINIIAYGVTCTYNVNVVEAGASSLNVSYPTTKVYYEGDTFDPTGLVATLRKADGSTVVLSSSQYQIDNPIIKRGQNDIVIRYDDTIYSSIYILGKERTVTSVKIKTLPTTTSYAIGTREIDPKGLTCDVTYEQGAAAVVKADDLEIVAPVVSKGDNSVIVCYDNYSFDSFTVTGIIPNEAQLVSNFVTKVNAIESITDMAKRFAAITECIGLRVQLKGSTDAAFLAASDKLDAYITAYNADVDKYNNDFNKVVTTSGNLLYTTMSSSGLAAALFVIMAIILKF